MNPHEGMTLGSRYTLTDRIASGGMGDVWRAGDSVLGREVAVKVMRPNASDDPTFADRFRDEARHTASLTHPNIATVYDYGEDDGAPYLVMELVEGKPLSQLVAEGPMPPGRVRNITGQAALALAAAHAAGVVHRDVKPANILVTPEGRVKLTDFGIARASDSAGHTRTGEVLGTPHYLSPEQALGRGATGASDIYALGVVAHEMLTGRKPFDAGAAVATALAQVNDPPPELPDSVPGDLRRLVMSCLAKDPAARPASAAALAAALGMPVGGLSHVSPATSVIHTGDTDPGATQVIPGALAAGAVGAAAGVAAGAGATAMLPAPTASRDAPLPYDDGGYDDRSGRLQPPAKRRRSGAGWWWVPVVVALAAIGFLVWQYASNNASKPLPLVTVTTTLQPTTPSTTTTSSSSSTNSRTTTTTSSSSSTPTTPTSAVITPGDLVGKTLPDVRATLTALGFRNFTQATAVSKQPVGIVTDVSPAGQVPLTTPVTITVSDGSATAGRGPGKSGPGTGSQGTRG